MFDSSGVTFDVTLSGFHSLTRTEPDQAGAALISYYLARGHHWSDTTAIGEAIDLVDAASPHLPDLAPELRSYLLRRKRRDGSGYSVADVGRVQWYRRRAGAWQDIAPVGVAWPGAAAWEILRIRHLRDQGWGHREVANALDLRPRLVRERMADLDPPPVVGAGWIGSN